MWRLTWLTAAILMVGAAAYAAEQITDLTGINRTIQKEPIYRDTPRYALLAFGADAAQRAWLVIDGDNVAWIDRNGNGDLTDDGERVERDRSASDRIRPADSSSLAALHVFPIGEVAGATLSFHLWVYGSNDAGDNSSSPDSHPDIRSARKDLTDRNWRNGTLYRTVADGVKVDTPLALTTAPEDAQICHLFGPLTFATIRAAHQHLERWPKPTVLTVRVGSLNHPPRGWTRPGFDFTPLATSELPDTLQPVARLEYPPAGPGGTCRATFTVPRQVRSGIVTVTVSCPPSQGNVVRSAQSEIPVVQQAFQTPEVAYVMFHAPRIELKDAVNVLRKARMDVVIQADRLLIRTRGTAAVGVRLSRDPEVHEVSTELAADTEFAERLSRCDARFEIGPFVSDQTDTVRQIAQLLQSLTDGFLYQTWNQQLSGPM